MKIIFANYTHNDALCHLMRTSIMPGSMQIAYLRDPDYFAALDIQGSYHQTIIGLENQILAGAGSRSIREYFINGEKTSVGYLSGLRIDPSFQNMGFLARGYKKLFELHQDRRTQAYYTTIISDNLNAKKILSSGRAGLPVYENFGKILTYLILCNKYAKAPDHTYVIRRANSRDIDTVTQFLNDEGKSKNLFPFYHKDMFLTSLFLNFKIDQFYLIFDQGELAGVTGIWDQSSFKQYKIINYSFSLKVAKPILNAFLSFTGYRKLPGILENLHVLYLLSPCIKGNNPVLLEALIRQILFDYRNAHYTGLLAGFHENDTIKNAVHIFQKIKYESNLYFVYKDDGKNFVKSLDLSRPFHVEVAIL